MHAVLVTPIGIGIPGNGLSQRCELWADALAELGQVTRIVVPVVGPADDDPNVVIVEPTAERWPFVPELARGITPTLGASIGNDIYESVGPADVVVGIRSYLGHMCIGLRDALAARLIIDLDDDDAAFFAARGDVDEAERFRKLVQLLSTEAAQLTSAQGFGKSVQLTNGVNIPENIDQNGLGTQVLFLGNMGYQPNYDAASLLIDKIAPEIRRQLPLANIVIAGPGSENFGSHGLGFVDDLEQLMADTDVLAVPLQEGAGTRIKILDAWAHEVPVVSTSIGAEGLGAIHEQDILIADEVNEIADAVVRVISNPSLSRQLVANGKAAVRKFSREGVIERAQSIIRESLENWWEDGQPSSVVAVALEKLHIVETETGLIVLNTTTGDVHELTTTAAVIFSLIDGESTTKDIATQIQDLYNLDELPLESVESAISDVVEIGIATRVRLNSNRLRFK